MKHLIFFASLIFFLSASCSKSNLLDKETGMSEEISTEEFEAMLNDQISGLNVNEVLLFYKEEGKYMHEALEQGANALVMTGHEKTCCRAAGNDAFAAHVKDMLDKGRCVEIALDRWGSAVAAERDCQ